MGTSLPKRKFSSYPQLFQMLYFLSEVVPTLVPGSGPVMGHSVWLSLQIHTAEAMSRMDLLRSPLRKRQKCNILCDYISLFSPILISLLGRFSYWGKLILLKIWGYLSFFRYIFYIFKSINVPILSHPEMHSLKLSTFPEIIAMIFLNSLENSCCYLIQI